MSRRSHKYGAVATVVDGIRFASKAEAARYQELKVLQKAGVIHGLTLQRRYELSVENADYPENGGRLVVIGVYVADFVYFEKGDGTQLVIEDVKGVRTDLYKWKKRHFEAQYGLTITEIGRRSWRRRRAA